MRRQLLIIVSVAVVSFLIGTMFNVTTLAVDGGNPFDKIWQAINDLQARVTSLEQSTNTELQGRVENIEKYVNEITRVELVRIGSYDGAPYTYQYGVSGHWNVTKLQTEPFIEKLNSTITGDLKECGIYDAPPLDPEYGKGYERSVCMAVCRELSLTEIEEVRRLIQEYLAKP